MSAPWLLVAADFVSTGGMDRANLALAEYLAARGDPIHLVTHRIAAGLAARSNVVQHLVPRPLGWQLLGDPLLDARGRAVAREVRARGGRVVVNGGNCDVDDANWVHYVHAAYRPDVPRHPLRGPKAIWAHHKSLRDEARVLRRSWVVIADSKRTARDVIERVGVPAERVHTVYYGIDPALFRPPTENERTAIRTQLGVLGDRPVVLFVGGLGDRRKGFDVLFTAWEALERSGEWDAELWVVGRGRELPTWRARAERSGLSQSVRFLGFRKDVPTLLAAADALVSPTRYEAYGLGVHEALCVGLPALVSAGAGVAERYPAELNDLLIPDPDDAADLAARLRRWRDRRSDLRAGVATLSERLRGYRWADMARDMVALIERT